MSDRGTVAGWMIYVIRSSGQKRTMAKRHLLPEGTRYMGHTACGMMQVVVDTATMPMEKIAALPVCRRCLKIVGGSVEP